MATITTEQDKDKPVEKDVTRQPRPDAVTPDVTDAEVEGALADLEAGAKKPPGKKPGEDAGAAEVEEDLVDDGKGGRRNRTHAERREAQRRAAAADKTRISELEAQNRELAERVGRVEGRTAQNDRASLEANIAGTASRISAAKEAKRAARAANDVESEELADEALYAARRQHETLAAIKARVEHEDRLVREGGGVDRGPPPVDPQVKKLAGGWIAKHDWYDTTLRDEDSKITYMVDAQIKADGYDPRTSEYYDELNKRLARRLPHRFTKAAGGGKRGADADEDDDAAGAGREADHGGGSPTGGSSRESAAAGEGQRITIPKDYIQAVKDAGLDWDDPAVKKRMTARYIQERKNLLGQQNR